MKNILIFISIAISLNTLEDNKYVYRARQICEKYNIKLVIIYDYENVKKD